jgi:hypothetical protein
MLHEDQLQECVEVMYLILFIGLIINLETFGLYPTNLTYTKSINLFKNKLLIRIIICDMLKIANNVIHPSPP